MWESQREESKQVRINDTQTGFFPPFCGRRKEGAQTGGGEKKLVAVEMK